MPRAGIYTIHASEHPDFENHEAVYLITDPKVALLGIIAIHRLEHNPDLNQRICCGGTRRRTYANPHEFYKDALRLSAGMTKKSAWAGTRSGGAKVVLWGDPSTPTHDDYWKSYADVLNYFEGSVRTGEDVGITMEIADKLRAWTPWVFGHSQGSGDPSPVTALGVHRSIVTCIKERYQQIDGVRISDYSFAVQGMGKVGYNLLKTLHEQGVTRVRIADTNEKVLDKVKQEFPDVIIVDPAKIHKVPVHVFAPCAMGGILNEQTIPELACEIICGSANNQLAHPKDGLEIHRRKILYAPDYIANVGGLINVACEFRKGGYSHDLALNAVYSRIPRNLMVVFKKSGESGKAPNIIADEEADRMIASYSHVIQMCEPIV